MENSVRIKNSRSLSMEQPIIIVVSEAEKIEGVYTYSLLYNQVLKIIKIAVKSDVKTGRI